MNEVRLLLNGLLGLVLEFGDLIVGAIVGVEVWVRHQLGMAGVPPPLQILILITVAALLIGATLRLFGGLIRVAVLLVLALITLHILMPVLRG